MALYATCKSTLLSFSVYWMEEGFVYLYGWFDHRLGYFNIVLLSKPKRRALLAWLLLFLLAFAIILPKTLKPQRYERLPEKWAGIWMRSQYGKGTAMLTTAPRVAFYADGVCEHIDFKKETSDKIKASMAERGARYLVFRGRTLADDPEIGKSINRNFIEVVRFEGKGMEKVVIFKGNVVD